MAISQEDRDKVTHFTSVAYTKGVYVGAYGSESIVINSAGNLVASSFDATASNRAIVSNSNSNLVASSSVTKTELEYLDGATANIQAQLDGKEPTLTKGNLTETVSSILTITGGSSAVIGTGATIEVAQASSSASGYLSSTDWNTFNDKVSFDFTASNDNRLLRTDTVGANQQQETGITVDDSNNVSGMGTLGCGTITNSGIFSAPAGSESAPTYTFTGDEDTGVFRGGTNQLNFTTAGTERVALTASRFTSTVPFRSNYAGASNSTPNYSNQNDTDTGMYLAGSDDLRLVSGGTVRVQANATGLGFFAATPVAQPDVTGSTGGNAALQNLLTALANLGLITDSST